MLDLIGKIAAPARYEVWRIRAKYRAKKYPFECLLASIDFFCRMRKKKSISHHNDAPLVKNHTDTGTIEHAHTDTHI